MAEELALGSRRLSEDHRRSLEDLYATHFTAVLRRCQRILGNPDDGADAAQEVFLRAIEFTPRERTNEQMRPWLLMVAHNYCVDLLRRRKRLDGLVRNGGGMLEQNADPEGTTITRHTVATVLAGLRVRERQALWQSAVEGHSPAGIARSLGLSYMAAAQLLHRARRHALIAAARVAAILYVFLRRPSRAGHARLVSRLVALGSVPLLAATIPSAASPHQAAPRQHVTVSSSTATVASVSIPGRNRPAEPPPGNPTVVSAPPLSLTLQPPIEVPSSRVLTNPLSRLQSCVVQTPSPLPPTQLNPAAVVSSPANCVGTPLGR